MVQIEQLLGCVRLFLSPNNKFRIQPFQGCQNAVNVCFCQRKINYLWGKRRRSLLSFCSQMLDWYNKRKRKERKSIYVAPFRTKVHTKRSG